MDITKYDPSLFKKRYGKAAAAFGTVFCADLPLLNGKHALDQSQSQTVPLLLVGAVCLIEFVENMLLRLRAQSRSGVLHGKDDLLLLFGQRHPHKPAFGAELDRVADQIVPHVAHHRFISQILDPLQLHIELNVLRLPRGFQINNGLSDLLIEPVQAAVKALEGGAMAALDMACDNALIKYLKGQSLAPFGEGQLIGYLLAKESELVSVRTVMAGRKAKLSPEQITERLRNSYV